MFPLYIFLLLLAGSVYLYLSIRASLNPVSNWGDPSSMKALFDHMTLAQYSGWIDYSWDNLVMSARLFFASLLNSWWWIGAIAAVSGTIAGFVAARTRTISALLILITSLILASSHRALNYEPFYIPATFACLLLCGNLIIFAEKRTRSNGIRYSAMAILPTACLILLLHNYRGMDRSRYALAEQYGRHMLDTAGGGILFTAGDINSFPSLYLRYAENYKPDVEVYDRSVRLAALMNEARRLSGRKVSSYNEARGILLKRVNGRKFLAKIHYLYEPDWLEISEPLFSYGILYSVSEKPGRPPEMLRYPDEYEVPDVLSRQLLVNLDLARGEQLLYESPADSSLAREAYVAALKRLDDEPQAVVLNNVGIYFRNAGVTDMALTAYRRALEKPILSRKDRSDIIYNISNVYKDMGNRFLESQDYRKAVASYEEALEYDRDNVALLLNIGLIFAREIGDTTSARAFLERYLVLNPNDSRVREYLETLR